jgi:hypothetical protein
MAMRSGVIRDSAISVREGGWVGGRVRKTRYCTRGCRKAYLLWDMNEEIRN